MSDINLLHSNYEGKWVRWQSQQNEETWRQMEQVLDASLANRLMRARKLFATGEREADATNKEFLAVQTEGTRRVRRTLKQQKLDAIVSVGYRVNSKRGGRFRQ